MITENGQISFRQVYRLYLFSLIGIGTTVVPARLARVNGIYGVISILLGAVVALLYISYLKWTLQKMQTDLFSYIASGGVGGKKLSRICFFYLALSAVVSAGYVGRIFTQLILHSLTERESYFLILALLFLAGGYAVSGGIESRARVYELLFYLVLIPMFLLLLISLSGVQVLYFEVKKLPDVEQLLFDGYLCFLPYESLFFSLVLFKYVKKDTTRLFFSVRMALIGAAGILLAFYLILLGTFGANALSQMQFPAVTLLSNVQFQGGFIKRLDMLMMGIWFFTLYALMNMNLHYASVFLKETVKKNGKRWYLFLCVIAAYLVSIGMEQIDWVEDVLLFFLTYISAPLYLLLPAFFVFSGRKRV